MYRYRLHQGERVSYAVLRTSLADTEFSLLRHTKSGELYGVPISTSPMAKNLYRLVGLRYSSKPFKL